MKTGRLAYKKVVGNENKRTNIETQTDIDKTRQTD